MYRIVFLLLSSLLLFSCKEKKMDTIDMPYYNDPDFNPIFIKNKIEVAEKITHQIDSFSFLNQDSIIVTQSIFKNKIHVANFIFTTCGSICPIMTSNFKMVSDSFKNNNNVVILSYSVTPWIDKPSVLKKYINKNGINNLNWHFLTGDRTSIYKLARQSYFAEENIGFSKDSSQFLHTEHVILVDRTNRIRGVYNGTLSLEMQHLIEDIRSLENENN
ncbi:MAG: SCO family protein [Bacteroidetes bacterium]|nr:SCO family protein [Bacteroidota bacterium]